MTKLKEMTRSANLIVRFWRRAAGGIRTRWGGGGGRRWGTLDQNTMRAGFIRLKVGLLIALKSAKEKIIFHMRRVCVWFVFNSSQSGGLFSPCWTSSFLSFFSRLKPKRSSEGKSKRLSQFKALFSSLHTSFLSLLSSFSPPMSFSRFFANSFLHLWK